MLWKRSCPLYRNIIVKVKLKVGITMTKRCGSNREYVVDKINYFDAFLKYIYKYYILYKIK